MIATPEFDKPTETFISRHRDELPFQFTTITGRPFRFCNQDESDLSEMRFIDKAVCRVKRAFGTPDEQNHFRLRRISKWLESLPKPTVMLGEYGMYARDLVKPCRDAKIPLIVHFHGFDAFNREEIDPILPHYREMFDYASALVGVSEAMKTRLVKLGAASSKTHRIPYPVDPRFQAIADPVSSEPNFLAVGRFVEKKAPYLTILAFNDALKATPSARLVMIGEGPLLGPCETLATALGIRDKIEFCGVLSHEAVGQRMQQMRCFVQHSVEASNGDCEGTPLAILEAQAAGLPVVSTFHSGISEAVLHGETGFLVAEKDISGMANYMTVFANNPTLAARMGSNATHRVFREYSQENTQDRLANLITSVSGLSPSTNRWLER